MYLALLITLVRDSSPPPQVDWPNAAGVIIASILIYIGNYLIQKRQLPSQVQAAVNKHGEQLKADVKADAKKDAAAVANDVVTRLAVDRVNEMEETLLSLSTKTVQADERVRLLTEQLASAETAATDRAADYNKRIGDLQKQAETDKAAIGELQKQIATLTSERDTALKAAKSERELAASIKAETGRQMEQYRQRITELEGSLQRVERDLLDVRAQKSAFELLFAKLEISAKMPAADPLPGAPQ